MEMLLKSDHVRRGLVSFASVTAPAKEWGHTYMYLVACMYDRRTLEPRLRRQLLVPYIRICCEDSCVVLCSASSCTDG